MRITLIDSQDYIDILNGGFHVIIEEIVGNRENLPKINQRNQHHQRNPGLGFGRRLPHQFIRAGERRESSGVGPVAAQHCGMEPVLREIVIIYVGDFEFAAVRWRERPDNFEYIRRIAINSGHSKIRWWIFRLFDYANDLHPIHFRNSETLGVFYFLQQNMRRILTRHKLLDERRKRILENVISQNYANRLARRKSFRKRESLRDAAGFILHTVSERAMECAAGAEQLDEIAHVLRAGHDQNIFYSGGDELLNRIKDHRHFADGKQMLIRDGRARVQARPRPSGKNNADAIW
jgi:hypothetical protein